MGFIATVSNIRPLFTYEQAKSWEERSIPYRSGRNKGLKPLSDRRRDYLQIRKERVGEREDIVVKMYGTDIVRYKPNGDIVLCMGGWDTQSTRAVISRVAGACIFSKGGTRWVQAYEQVTDEQGGNRVETKYYPFPANSEETFRRIKNSYGDYYHTYLQYIDPTHPSKHTLNRKAFNAKKKLFEGFITYLTAAAKLRAYETPTREEANESGMYEPLPLAELIEMMGNEDKWYQASVVVLRRCVPRNQLWRNSHTTTQARINREIKDSICTHWRDELFTEEVVTDGTMVVDSNRKYMRGNALYFIRGTGTL